MSIKIFGKKLFKNKLEKERDLIKDKISEIADEYEEYESEHGETLYTEQLQIKQQKLFDRLDELTKQVGFS